MSSAALRDGILTVPVIDISSFRMPYADPAARSEVVRQVDEAARTVGFMQITGHGIPASHAQRFHQGDRRVLRPRRIGQGQVPLPARHQPRLHPAEGGIARQQPRPCLAPRTCSRRSTSAARRRTSPGSTCRKTSTRRTCTRAEVPGFEAAVTAWFETAGRVARTMVRIFGVALGGTRGLLRAVHRPLDRRAAHEQLPAARARRPAGEGPARHGRAHRLRHRDRALGRPGAWPGDPRRRRELAPGHAGRRRAARQPGRRASPAGPTRSGSPPCTASPRRGSTAGSSRGGPPPTSTTATSTR